jgi:hypothetical protein
MKPCLISQEKELVAGTVKHPSLQIPRVAEEEVGILNARARLRRASLIEDLGPDGREFAIVRWRDAELSILEPGQLLAHSRVPPVFLLFAINIEEKAVDRLCSGYGKGKSSENRALIEANGVRRG